MRFDVVLKTCVPTLEQVAGVLLRQPWWQQMFCLRQLKPKLTDKHVVWAGVDTFQLLL
jgi:hypothetical protein